VATGAADSFAAQAKTANGQATEGQTAMQTSSVRAFRDLPGYGRIETLTVTETTTGPDGKPMTTVKELAVCPECGTANCSCLSRVTMQSRLDEENAKGPRDKEKPQPYSVLPQTFNQMSATFHASQGNSPPRLFG
jgi:hypothetical protein